MKRKSMLQSAIVVCLTVALFAADVHATIEVWYGSDRDGSDGIHRVDLDGNPLGWINTNYYASGLAVTPEPVTVLLLGLGGLALRRRRR